MKYQTVSIFYYYYIKNNIAVFNFCIRIIAYNINVLLIAVYTNHKWTLCNLVFIILAQFGVNRDYYKTCTYLPNEINITEKIDFAVVYNKIFT